MIEMVILGVRSPARRCRKRGAVIVGSVGRSECAL